MRLWYPTDAVYDGNIKNVLMRAWKVAGSQVKVNASVGCILRRKTDGNFRYFHSLSHNATLFDSPMLIKTVKDMRNFTTRLGAMGLEAVSSWRRPNAQGKLFVLTNLTTYIYKFSAVQRISAGSAALPARLMKDKNILMLSARNRVPFNDNLCFFRCLAIHRLCVCPRN